jgi:hypothetical protein
MTITKLIHSFNLLLIAAFLFNCNSSDKTSITEKSNPYFPASKGNKWEYINEVPREETEIYKVEVLSTTRDGSDIIAELSSFPFFSKKEEKSTLKIKHDGSVYYNNDTLLPQNSNLVKDYNWKFGDWTGYIGSTTDTVKAENETFTNCILISYSISITFAADIWLARDKGIVKWGYNRTNPPTFKPLYYVLNKLTLAK